MSSLSLPRAERAHVQDAFGAHRLDLPDLSFRVWGGPGGFRFSPDSRARRNSAPQRLRCSISIRRHVDRLYGPNAADTFITGVKRASASTGE